MDRPRCGTRHNRGARSRVASPICLIITLRFLSRPLLHDFRRTRRHLIRVESSKVARHVVTRRKSIDLDDTPPCDARQ
eukprot:951950-Pyramimonas_sp.AAC.1